MIGPSHFSRRRFELQNPAFCLCFLSSQKNASTSKIFEKNVVVCICGPPVPTWPKVTKQMYSKNFARVSPFIQRTIFRAIPPGGSPTWSLEAPLPRYGKRNFRLIYIYYIYIYIIYIYIYIYISWNSYYQNILVVCVGTILFGRFFENQAFHKKHIRTWWKLGDMRWK